MISEISLHGNLGGDAWDAGQSFGGDRSFDYILKQCDWGTASVNATAMVLGNDSNETIVHYAWEPRSVIISGYILGSSEQDINSKKVSASAIYQGGKWFKLLYHGFALQFYLTSDISFGQSAAEDHDVWCEFTITGQCEDVRFYNENAASVNNQTALGRFRFPLAISLEEPVIMGIVVDSDDIVYFYSGTVDTGMLMTITPLEDVPSLTVKVVSDILEQELFFNHSIIEGQTLVIDTRSGLESALLDGTDVSDSISGSWLRIMPGNNLIDTNAATLTAVTINTEPQYEVETT